MYRFGTLLLLAACQVVPNSPEHGLAAEPEAGGSAFAPGFEERADLVQNLWSAVVRAQKDEVEYYGLEFDNGEGEIGFGPPGVAVERLIRSWGGKPLPASEGEGSVFQERKYNRAGQILEVSR